MVAFRVGRRRPAHRLEVQDAELARRAGQALVAADDRIRAAAGELGFAEAELGDSAARQRSHALVAAHTCLSPTAEVATRAAIEMHRLS